MHESSAAKTRDASRSNSRASVSPRCCSVVTSEGHRKARTAALSRGTCARGPARTRDQTPRPSHTSRARRLQGRDAVVPGARRSDRAPRRWCPRGRARRARSDWPRNGRARGIPRDRWPTRRRRPGARCLRARGTPTSSPRRHSAAGG
jgi:hypothetical protein